MAPSGAGAREGRRERGSPCGRARRGTDGRKAAAATPAAAAPDDAPARPAAGTPEVGPAAAAAPVAVAAATSGAPCRSNAASRCAGRTRCTESSRSATLASESCLGAQKRPQMRAAFELPHSRTRGRGAAHGTRHAVGADGVARGQVQAGAEEGRFERAVAPQATHCRLPEPSKSGAASAPSWRLSLRLAPPPPSGPPLSSSLESVSFAAAVSACRGRGQGAWARGQTRARVRRHREIGPCSEHSGVGQARASGRCTWRALAGSAPRGRRNSGEPWAPC